MKLAYNADPPKQLHRLQAKFASAAMRNRNSGIKRLIPRHKSLVADESIGAKDSAHPDLSGEGAAIGAEWARFRWE
jgi:hypothetical protein